MSFEKIYYKGKEMKFGDGSAIKIKKVVDGVSYFSHIYRTSGFTKDAKRTHACLRHGYWCWKNLLERPKDILSFFKGKIT